MHPHFVNNEAAHASANVLVLMSSIVTGTGSVS
jgi:hypothetical protein